jgi:topoisomerase-4 subunit A
MESLFRATELETRFPLNMNVLDATARPRVMSLKEVLRAWLDHRHEVLVRRSNHRLARSSAAWKCWKAISSSSSISTR